jgi:hypothetical protein
MPIQDTNFWPASIDSSRVVTPGGGAAPSGAVAVTPYSDGRVHYDPYPACGDGAGRWIIVEMGNLQYSNGATAAAILVAISNGEDPNPADSGVSWNAFAIASTAPANSMGSDNVAADFPQVGFNTNWIAITAQKFFAGVGGYAKPLLFVFERQTYECGAIVPSSPALLPTSSGGSCTGTSGTSTSAWFCNDSLLSLACPVVNYHPAGSDPDGANLFLVRSAAPSTGTLDLYEITGNAASPLYGNSASVSTSGQPGPGGGWTWSGALPTTLQQGGPSGTKPIATGPNDDRIVSCVDRAFPPAAGFSGPTTVIYAAHTIGLPASNPTSTEVQWWTIYHFSSAGSLTASLLDIERIGGHTTPCDGDLCYDTIDPSIAVNAAGDLVIGYSGLPDPAYAGPGYLGAFFTLKSHSGCAEQNFWFYAGGLGPYFPGGDDNGKPVRTGDYSQTVVDPVDDTGFMTTGGWAGSVFPPSKGSGYGWMQNWNIIEPQNVAPPAFAGHTETEDECPSTEVNCKIHLAAPPGAQAGDIFYAIINAGIANPDTLVSPSSWTRLIFFPGNGDTFVTSDPICGFPVFTYALVHEYTGSSDSGSYVFKVPRKTRTCGNLKTHSELVGDLASYRGACPNITNTEGDYNYSTAFAFSQSTDESSLTIGPITSPASTLGFGFPIWPAGDNTTALAWFYGSAESDDSSGGACSVLSQLSGAPTLTTEFQGSGCTGNPVLIGDYSPYQDSQTLGPYTVDDSLTGPKLGVVTIIPPY